MKLFIRLAMLFIAFLLILPESQSQSQSNSTRFQVQGRFTECALDTIRFFFLDGVSLRQVAKVPVLTDEQGKYFAAGFAEIPKGFYFVGGGQPANTRQVILGIDSLVFLRGTCQQYSQAEVLRSPSNAAYQQAIQVSEQLQNQSNQLNQQYQAARQRGQATGQIADRLEQLDQQKLALLDSVSSVDPWLRKPLALRTYLMAPSHRAGENDDLRHFARHYFSQADLSDPDYAVMPVFQESFQTYARTLGSISSLSLDTLITYCEGQLQPLGPPSAAHKSAILGLAQGFHGNHDDAFVHYAGEYLDSYPGDNPGFAQQLQQQVDASSALLIGAVAPDLALPTPVGDTLAISDLRGQVVLLDFWASWCRPCRIENPRVKRMYNTYQEQGFTILGISLDRSGEAWEKAIEADGLPWHHMSDLRGWRSAASQLYKVGAIPYTVLLDREGRILAKGLRGAALEAAVAEALAAEADD